MDASDIIRKKLARTYAYIQQNPAATTSKGQVPNNPPLTPSQRIEVLSQYPASEFASTFQIFPCGTSTICSTIYTAKAYYTSQ
jgi:hypothetical protein